MPTASASELTRICLTRCVLPCAQTLNSTSAAMAAGGRNPQKSAMARAKRQDKDAQAAKGGGGAAAIAERRGAGMADKMDATALRKQGVADRAAEKKKKEEEKLAREAKEKEKFLREEAKKKKLAEAKAGGGAAAPSPLEAIEKEVSPALSPSRPPACLCCVCSPHLSLLYNQLIGFAFWCSVHAAGEEGRHRQGDGRSRGRPRALPGGHGRLPERRLQAPEAQGEARRGEG